MQHSENQQTRPVSILLVGTEHMLLYTRKAILEKEHMAVSISKPVEAVDRLRQSDFDVVITCHTLRPEEARQVSEAAKAMTRAPRLICFTRQPSPSVLHGSFDASIWSLSTPETTLQYGSAVLPTYHN